MGLLVLWFAACFQSEAKDLMRQWLFWAVSVNRPERPEALSLSDEIGPKAGSGVYWQWWIWLCRWSFIKLYKLLFLVFHWGLSNRKSHISLQNSSAYSNRSQLYCDLYSLDSSSDFQFSQSLTDALRYCSTNANYNYLHHLYVPLIFSILSPRGSSSQNSSCTATYLPSRKLFKLDEPDTQETAGEVRTKS